METQDSHCVHKSRQQIQQVIDRAQVTWWCRWLRHCATSRKGTSSIPYGVTELSRPQGSYGPRVDSASNINECQE